jgi:succinyl-diaminopimelate desuccinylase
MNDHEREITSEEEYAMSFERVLSEVDKAENEITELCSRLVQFNSAHPEGRTDECVAFIKEYFDKHGIEAEIHSKNPIKPNIVATIPGTGDRKILWVGHLDVVPEGQADSWAYSPYGGKITDDGFIHGRGSSDMKGACAGAMVAARILSELKEPIENSVDFWFTADEEIGGTDGARWLAEEKRFKGDVCIIGDGNGGGLENPCIDLGCKGSARTKLIARGKTSHGSAPYLGENAITKLMKVIPWVEKIGEYQLELPEEVEGLIPGTLDFHLKTQTLTQEQEWAAKHSLRHPTVTCKKINVVPDYAEAEFDIRLTPGSNPVKVKERIEQLVKESGVSGVETSIMAREVAGYYESPELAFTQQLSDTIQRITGKTPILKFLMGGTDALSIKYYMGIPCLGYGASMTGQAHQPDERNTVENLLLATKAYAAFPLIYRG